MTANGEVNLNKKGGGAQKFKLTEKDEVWARVKTGNIFESSVQMDKEIKEFAMENTHMAGI